MFLCLDTVMIKMRIINIKKNKSKLNLLCASQSERRLKSNRLKLTLQFKEHNLYLFQYYLYLFHDNTFRFHQKH